MPRIPNNLRERAIGMLDAGMSTEHVARHVGCSSRAIRNLPVRCRTTGSTNDLPRLHNNRERERNVLFNDALNTFYLRLYDVRHMVNDHSDSEKGNPLSPHRLLLSINSKGSFIRTIPQTG